MPKASTVSFGSLVTSLCNHFHLSLACNDFRVRLFQATKAKNPQQERLIDKAREVSQKHPRRAFCPTRLLRAAASPFPSAP